MKQTEKILGVLIVLLVSLRLVYSYPYAAVLITLLSLVLSMLYFGFSFALLNNIRFRNILKKGAFKGISTLRVLGAIFTGFLLSNTVIYCLFKFQRWPYGNEGLLISIYGLAIVIIIALIKYITTKHSFYKSLLIRLFIIGVTAVSLYQLSYNELLKMKHRDNPEYIKEQQQLILEDTLQNH
ncbi:hypothetical protein [Pontimicrobium sp. IMCC45349]|uniref:hypothetical protein n=1 Tax=Pontimicrobium sp. IMCC45349 TaxID=3391574 RepID=UPI0039A2C56E